MKVVFFIGFYAICINSFSQEVECCDTVYTYYEDSSVNILVTVNSQGKEHGYLIKYFPNGQIEMRIEYKDGMIDGYSESWNLEGTLLRKVLYKNNLENGDYKTFNSDGSLKTHWVFLNGKFKEVIYGEPPF